MSLPHIDQDYLLKFLTDLLNTPSPTGYTHRAIEKIKKALTGLPELKSSRTRKGALVAIWPGERDDTLRALTAHVDTLGAMVKEIKSNGRLKPTKIGGFAWNTKVRHPMNSMLRCALRTRVVLIITVSASVCVTWLKNTKSPTRLTSTPTTDRMERLTGALVATWLSP